MIPHGTPQWGTPAASRRPASDGRTPVRGEDGLYAHPAVAEAAVVAAPHEVKGEASVAFVVLESDASEGTSDESDGVLEEGAEVTEEELRRFSLDHVPTYAHPRRIFFAEELPRSATQKFQRYKLEAEAESMLDGPLESGEGL